MATIADREAAQVARADEAELTPVVAVHGRWLAPTIGRGARVRPAPRLSRRAARLPS